MKTCKILICALFLLTQVHAQNTRSVFRKGYLRFGFSTLGGNVDNNLSPAENVLKGNYGASTGIAFESGHIFYFKSSHSKTKFNYGLDWTILSATYNKLNEWNSYAGNNNVSIDGTKISASLSSKLGPDISFNPVEKLIIDIRFQVMPVIRFSDLEYDENEGETNEKSFSFRNYGQENIDAGFNAESVKNMLAFGIGTNCGISVRRKAIGLALDYSSVQSNTEYDAYDGTNHTFGKIKIPTHSFQVKLSISL